mgnify:CR=1 FL=1
MALVLNGSTNTIGGLAVGGLPDGSVDRDTLAANTGKKIWGSTVDTTSGTDHVLLSSIPADCDRFGWGWVECSVDTDGDYGVQMSTSGGYVTSNYKCTSSWMRTGNYSVTDISDSFISMTPPSSNWSASIKTTGNMTANRVKNNIWSFTGFTRLDDSTEYMGWNAGFVDLSGTLTAIKLHSEQTLDSGSIRAWYEIGGT